MPEHLQLLLILTALCAVYARYFVAAKFLSKDRSSGWREYAYILGAIIFLVIVRGYPSFSTLYLGVQLSVQYPAILDAILMAVRVLTIASLFLYFYKIKSYPVKKAVILTIFSDLFAFTAGLARSHLHYSFWPITPEWFNEQPLLFIATGLMTAIAAGLLAFIVTKATRQLRAKINNSAILQTAFMVGSLVCWLSIEIAGQIMSITADALTWWGIYYMLGYVVVSIISFFLFEKSLTARYALKQKDDEQRSMLFYLDEIEQQQAAMRKFKHDLQNLFSTLDIYIQDDDFNGLKQFYPKVRKASEIITKNEFDLEGLSKIKVREIKNIFIAKLAVAQNLKINTRLEVRKEINDIAVDAIAMVRMLGIILDNAIEELQALGHGELSIICIKSDTFIRFMIQNTCRAGMPPLKQLQQAGYTTKGEGRGLGLSNLYELINAIPNISLITGIEGGQFSQTLVVQGDVTA